MKIYVYGYMGSFIAYDSSCLCTCENPDSNVYINLREVVSDVHENKVITGIRIRKINDVFHLRVQQAKLLLSAAIDLKTKSWVKVKEYKTSDKGVSEGNDYHKLSWDLRSFELDGKYVVTGVRFTVDKGLIRLKVRGTRFNYQNGKLRAKQHFWHQNTTSKDQLKHFKLEYTDLPTKHPISQPVITDPGQYMTLTTSSMDTDIGQSVVPFIELKPIESEIPNVALSGIGLIHKSYQKNAAGYLAPKILTYNFT